MLTRDAVNAFISEGYRIGLDNYPMVNQDIPKLNIDVNLTSSCNLKCKYCYERGYFEPLFFSEDQLYVLCHRIEELLKSQWYRNNYKTLKIGFWGGEPTLNYPAMQFLMRYFEYYGDVSFLLYTNGVNLDKVMPSLIYFSNKTTMLNEPKVTVQVSYDGEPIQTKMRGCAVEVQNTIRDFMKYRVFHSVKSTLPFDCMEDMYDAYMDILTLQSSLQSPRLSFNYNPSLERLMKAPSEDYIQDRLEVFRQQLGYITRIERGLKTESPYLVWFNKRRYVCAAGKNLFAVDIDGSVFKCHGALYGAEKHNHCIGHIEHSNFIQELAESRKQHSQAQSSMTSPECSECASEVCYRCCVTKYDLSDKTNYFARWYDFANQHYMCQFYREISQAKQTYYKGRGD